MDGDDSVPLLLAHVEDHPVAQDAGHIDQDVQAAVGIEGAAHNGLAARPRGHGAEAGGALATGRADAADVLVGRGLVEAGAIDGDAGVVDDNPGACSRQGDGDGPAYAAARPPDPGTPPL